MKLSAARPTGWLCGLASLLATCRPAPADADQPAARSLLEAVPAGYYPVNRQDTLRSYWAPPAALLNPAFDYFARANLSEAVLQVRLIPASAARSAGLDTLVFRPVAADHGVDGKGWEGLNWFFDLGSRSLASTLLDAQGKPSKLFSARLYRVVTEERQPPAGRRYARNRYATEYPFCPLPVAHVGDSVAYVRAYLLRGNVPQADTLYAASATASLLRLPHEANLLDTTQLALLCFRLQQVRHSATPAGY